MKVHERVKKFMDDNGIKQNHVASKVGFNPKTFNALFHGRRKMSADEFESICILGLGVNPAYFFSYEFLEVKKLNPKPQAS